MTWRSFQAGAIVTIALALSPAAADAQQTRAELIAAAQARKARELKPYEPSKAEQVAGDIQKRLLSTPQGLYPWFDSVYSGGGFTLGAGYRRFFGDAVFWETRGLFSAKSYKLIEFAVDSMNTPRILNPRFAAGWRDATQVAFYGIGSATTVEGRSNFEMQQGYASVGARVQGRGPLFADVGLRFDDYTLKQGRGSSPSIEQVYTPASAPGLGDSPSYLRTTLSGGLDSRPSPGYARRGGLYAVSYDVFADQSNGGYSFEILQGEIVQHVPILRENWVVSVHAVAKTTVDDEDTVPYFLMPSLGSGSTLRAYPSWRFRDRHSLLLSGEWRWMPSMFLDVALFYDAGTVAARREDLNLSGLHHNWGLGFRFHSPLATPLRIEFAHGREGFNLVFSGAAAF
jgi:hypothetical protein